MINLIKADYFRILKDTLFIVAIVAIIVFSLITPLTLFLLNPIIEASFAEYGNAADFFSINYTGKYIFSSSLSLSNNIGFILPVLIGIIVCRDFTSGTVRNKLIAGHKKTSVYFSHLITATTLTAVLYVLYALLSLVFGILFFGYGSRLDGGEIAYIFKILLSGILLWGTSVSFTVFIACVLRNTGLVIIIQLASAFLISIVGSIPTMLPQLPTVIEKIAMILPPHQTMLALSQGIDTKLLLYIIVSSAVYIALHVTAGILIYRKSEQK